MGVDTRIVVYAPSKAVAEGACTAAFARIADLEAIMSDYRRDSELMRLSDTAVAAPVRVSADLFKVLQRSQEISQRSRGYFDVTVGPIVRIWRKARKTGKLPTAAELDRARRLVGWQKLKLDAHERTVRLAVRGMQLDLGAIGKGYADDEAQTVLKKYGITRALVEMGGDIVVTDPPPGQVGWTIRVPNAGGHDRPKDMRFANCAISSSGDTEEFVIIGGLRFSHVVDPHTGQALTNRVQATIIGREGLTTDPLGTALTLLGPRDRARLLKHYPGTKAYVRSLAPTEK
jgi:thiamine biosynthesis lipoprotein